MINYSWHFVLLCGRYRPSILSSTPFMTVSDRYWPFHEHLRTFVAFLRPETAIKCLETVRKIERAGTVNGQGRLTARDVGGSGAFLHCSRWTVRTKEFLNSFNKTSWTNKSYRCINTIVNGYGKERLGTLEPERSKVYQQLNEIRSRYVYVDVAKTKWKNNPI